MDVALFEIEAAIAELTKARRTVSRGTSKQVSAADEIDQLKAVAFAWFQTHRSLVANHASRPDLSAVDEAYKKVMAATGRHASRSTYEEGLKDARSALVGLRTAVAIAPSASITSAPRTSDGPPDFTPLAVDPGMQGILGRRWLEVQQCIAADAHLAATVMMGGLLETLLLARINSSSNQAAIFSAKHAARDKARKTLPLSDWKLVNMVEVAHELGWISKSAKDVGHVLREFRNYIHPHKEHTDGVSITADDSRMFWEVSKSISRQVLASVGKSP